ncbi:preprotein translocase subunit YajC [Actinomadura pelletieri DSM 43383]|uniref:Preprotein translocase subunit YajC n=1 Tax=Actinomadura pelletieri DSM 43383 TaxID=1120940 RepID=A0A495Q934_9ACTN|nr:preprotein translocase subunit YajC [Actinomadura pelletieri]RKS67820.1 preprotein translocase subunit YajC [Actinomadura pelletieri DSM 43383]
MGSEVILAAESGGSGAFNLLLLLAVPLVFYLLLIRPQSKRRKQQLEMQNAIEPGARVVTTSGMRATVVAVDDDGVLLEIADGVEVHFLRQAVMQVLKDDEPAELDDDQDGDEGRVDLAKDETATEDEATDEGTDEGTDEAADKAADDTKDDRTDETGKAEASGQDDEAAESKPRRRLKVKAADKPSA